MAKNNQVEDVSSLDSFKKITSVPNRLCAIHFHAPWATQCTSMDEAMQILAGEENYKGVTFARVEAEEQPEISMDYDVAAVPTLLFMEGEQSISENILVHGGPSPGVATSGWVDFHLGCSIFLPTC